MLARTFITSRSISSGCPAAGPACPTAGAGADGLPRRRACRQTRHRRSGWPGRRRGYRRSGARRLCAHGITDGMAVVVVDRLETIHVDNSTAIVRSGPMPTRDRAARGMEPPAAAASDHRARPSGALRFRSPDDPTVRPATGSAGPRGRRCPARAADGRRLRG